MVPGADQVWHKKLVAVVSQVLSQDGKQNQAGGLSQVERLVNENYKVDSLFPSDHAKTGIFFS